MEPVAVIGLGNPGERYHDTRHNLGFRVAEELAARRGVRFRPGPGPYLLGEDGGLLLVKPTTFMNLSGVAAAAVRERFGVEPASMLVVVDDFWLSLGRIRFRRRGRDGGHNGLASVIGTLLSSEFPRLRLGIGREVMPPKDRMAEFVLSPFAPEELPLVSGMVARAADAAEQFVVTGTAVPRTPPARDGGGPPAADAP